MIIQCKQCSARFSFDDHLMRKDGVWVRCSLCQYEFFVNHPDGLSPEEPIRAGDPGIDEIRIAGEPSIPHGEAEEGGRGDEPAIGEQIMDDEAEAVEGPQKRFLPKPLIAAVYVLVAIVLMAGAAWVLFPGVGQQASRELAAYLPGYEQEKPERPVIPEGIQITAVKQRFVPNLLAGNLRVVEGVVINQSDRPLTRIRMKAVLVDAANSWLGERRSYVGNILTESELVALSGEEIERKLSNPQGATVSNDRIPPGAQIPFMIVWSMEPPGTAKTFVAVVGAERLLQ